MTELLPPGAVFAGYVIERVLGSGGMGTVYLARHPRLPRHDALKVLPAALSADPEYRARFLREAETAGRIDHPSVVAIHDRGVADGRLWIAMQFVDGIDAAELIRRHPGGVPPETAARIVDQAAAALDEAHRAGLLHRDVKPANILLRQTGDRHDRVLLTDFGIAKAAAESVALTRTGAVLATLAYAAPEQLTGGTVDRRADVYALGCTLFELLTGRKPFPRSNSAAVMQAHIQEPPPPASALNPALPQAIDSVLARALAKRPADRYDSAGALAAAVTAGLGGVAETYRIPLPPIVTDATAPARRSRGRNPLRRYGLPVAGVLAVVAVIVSATVLLRDSAESSPAPLATSTGATTTGGISWGNFGFIVAAFPRLLPATPVTSGHQGIRCAALDGDDRTTELQAQLPRRPGLTCQGNGNPVSALDVSCSSDRAPRNLAAWGPGMVGVGSEHWERPSGKGRVAWGDATDDKGIRSGIVHIQFDDTARNFCLITVWGADGTVGTDLMDRWWRDAPL